MKNTLNYIADGAAVLVLALLVLFASLLAYGIQEPKRTEIYAAYRIPVIGTTARAIALQVADDNR